MDRNGLSQKLAALFMSLALIISFTPLFDAYSYADSGSETGKTKAFIVNDDGSEVPISEEELEALRAGSTTVPPEDIEVTVDEPAEEKEAQDVTGSTEVSESDVIAPEDGAEGETTVCQLTSMSADAPLYEEGILGAQEVSAQSVDPSYYNVQFSQTGNTVTLNGTIDSPYKFGVLVADNSPVKNIGSTTVNQKLDLSVLDTGYHTIGIAILDNSGNVVDAIGKTFVPVNNISEKPNYKGVYEVYSKYFYFNPFDFGKNNAGSLYMEYRTGSGNWQRTGYMKVNSIQLYSSQSYKISGLKAKKTYKTRLRYGEIVTYSTSIGGDGNSYFFGGPALNSRTIKTGASSKPKIKSVRCKAVKVRYHKVRHYGPYTGVYLYTEKYYSYNIKVIVKLKKKPGTKGLFINGRWKKGNKKTYTTTFVPLYGGYSSKHPRGRIKYTVTVRSGQSKSYGGYSPQYKKTKKLS